MTVHPLSMPHASEVPGLAYYTALSPVHLPHASGPSLKTARPTVQSRAADALAAMYGYYAPSE